MAYWNCEDCGVMMDADDEGEPETCPRCGKDMANFAGAAGRTSAAEACRACPRMF